MAKFSPAKLVKPLVDKKKMVRPLKPKRSEVKPLDIDDYKIPDAKSSYPVKVKITEKVRGKAEVYDDIGRETFEKILFYELSKQVGEVQGRVCREWEDKVIEELKNGQEDK